MSEAFASDIRLPSHLSPPFRARQWLNNAVGVNPLYIGNLGYIQFDPDNTVQTYAVQWNQGMASFSGSTSDQTARGLFTQLGPPVPSGMLGVLSSVHWAAVVIGVNVAPLTNFQLSIYLNGAAVPGYTDLQAQFRRSVVSTDGRTIIDGRGAQSIAPVHLREGDKLDVEVSMRATLSFTQATMRVGGWLYPLQVDGDAGSIRSTQADPRARNPLGGS